jgi:hypothetical protein
MGKKTGNQGAVYLGAYDVSGDLNGVDTTQDQEVPETTGMSSTSKSFLPTVKAGMVSWKGMFDFDPIGLAQLNNVLTLGNTYVSTFLPGGDTLGARSLCGQAQIVKDHKISAPVAGIVTMVADFECSSGLDQAKVALPKTTDTGTGAAQNGTAVDNTAASTNGGRAYFHLFAVDAATTTAIKIQHSTDNITFTDLVTSTLTGVAIGADSVAINGTINRYTRVTRTTTSGKHITLQASLARY